LPIPSQQALVENSKIPSERGSALMACTTERKLRAFHRKRSSSFDRCYPGRAPAFGLRRWCCHLREASFRNPLIEAMHFKDGQIYCLDRYVIIPNHVHALILPAEGERLSSIVANWKKFSAKSSIEAFSELGRSGRMKLLITLCGLLIDCRHFGGTSTRTQ